MAITVRVVLLRWVGLIPYGEEQGLVLVLAYVA